MIKEKYAAAVAEARELSAQNGYDFATWMVVLNRGTGKDPERLRRASKILEGLADSMRESAGRPNS